MADLADIAGDKLNPIPNPIPSASPAKPAPTPVTDAVAAEPEVDLSALKIAELRDMCESKGLSNRGKKEELVARLSESARGPPQSSLTRDERAENRERAGKRSRPDTETKGEFD